MKIHHSKIFTFIILSLISISWSNPTTYHTEQEKLKKHWDGDVCKSFLLFNINNSRNDDRGSNKQ
jgi:hypothetical protein